MVHQHFTSVPALTVAENVALTAGWRVVPEEMRERTRALSERMGLPLDPDQRAGRLSASLKQRLEVVKALASDARILLLDEPTAVLAPPEAEELLEMIRGFTGRGGAAVLITHKLDEALRASDRITVLRQGSVVLTSATEDQTVHSLARAMIGEGASVIRPSPRRGLRQHWLHERRYDAIIGAVEGERLWHCHSTRHAFGACRRSGRDRRDRRKRPARAAARR